MGVVGLTDELPDARSTKELPGKLLTDCTDSTRRLRVPSSVALTTTRVSAGRRRTICSSVSPCTMKSSRSG